MSKTEIKVPQLGEQKVVPVDKIIIGKNRKIDTKSEDFIELKNSIEQQGLLQPILIAQTNGKLNLVAGKRRLRAHMELGLKEIPAYVRDLDPAAARMAQLTENINRKDLSDVEEIEMYKLLLDEGFRVSDISQKVGKTESYVALRCKCATAQPVFIKMLELGLIDLGLTMSVARMPIEVQKEIASEIKADKAIQKKDFNDYELKNAIRNRNSNLLETDIKLDHDYGLKNVVSAKCSECPKNSANSPELFPDAAKTKTQVCMDLICLGIKATEAGKEQIRNLVDKGIYLMVSKSADPEDIKAIKKVIIDHLSSSPHLKEGAQQTADESVLIAEKYEDVYYPDIPKEKDRWQSGTLKQQQDRAKKKREKIDALVKKGTYIEAVRLDGMKIGKKYIYKLKAVIKEKGVEKTVKEEKIGIQQRNERKDIIQAGHETVEMWKDIVKKNENQFLNNDKPLTNIQKIACLWSLDQALGYGWEELPVENVNGMLKKFNEKEFQKLLNARLRRFIIEQMSPQNESSPLKGTANGFLVHALAEELDKKKFDEIRKVYEADKKKRADRVKERISKL